MDPSRIVTVGMLIILVGIFGVGGWIALAPLHGAVIAAGEVKADTNRKTVQHLEGGIVKEIRVRDGDQVRAGQPLLLLEDVQVDATVEMLKQQLDAEYVRHARLLSERDGLDSIRLPEALQQRRDIPNLAETIRNEMGIFAARRSTLLGQIGLLQAQMAESKAELAGLEQQIAAETRAITLAEEELAINEALHAKKFVQNTRLIAIKRQLAQQEADRGEHVANESRVKQHVMDLELRMLELRNQYKQKAVDELEASASKVQELLERIRPYEDAKVRRMIVAPEDGVVVNLRIHTTGGVISPGEPVLDIVPQHSVLIVEGKAAISDIDDLRVGMDADIHLVAYRHRTTPLASGKLVYISADSLTSAEEKQPYYLIRVTVDQSSLDRIGNVKLVPGMPADIYIRTHTRTALQYFLEPVTRAFLKSFRES